VHLVNRDYEAMARDYYELDFLDRSVDVRPIVPALVDSRCGVWIDRCTW
jgi:hypothetical protein